MPAVNDPRAADADILALVDRLIEVGKDAPSLERKLEMVRTIREHSAGAAADLDRFLVHEMDQLRAGLLEAAGTQEKLRELLARLGAPPWHPAVYLGPATTPRGAGAVVLHGSAPRVVSLSDELDPSALALGDEVLLGPELNVVLRKSPHSLFRTGETARFERDAGDGRGVLKSRDEEVVVQLAEPLREAPLRTGDLVRWNREAWMAFEKIERSNGSHLFLQESPEEVFEDIGGLDRQIELLKRTIQIHLGHGGIAGKYRLRPKRSVLLAGPPGTGKTMMARALANWLGRLSRSGRSRFMNVKPSELLSVWYSESEANIREAFRIAREAGEVEPEVPVVMFFDEIDAIGAARGGSFMRVDDRVLETLMTELEGFDSRGNVLVVAATNRVAALDPALVRPGRLGDLRLDVPRPGMKAARAIFGKHLPEGIPYAGAAGDPKATRCEIIGAIASRLYTPNGGGDLAVVTLRDGKKRAVRTTDLVSGAVIAKIAQVAIEHACVREIDSGDSGVRLQDLLNAADEEFTELAGMLTPGNCRLHVGDLPQDIDVVGVEPIRRMVARAHRYRTVA